jgi:uncharacterized membrane protein
MALESPPASPATPKLPRIEAIDLARGAALIAMAVYHFTWDLEFFGYVEPGMTAHGGWKLFARCIASSFLFLVGVSLYLAHGKGMRWRGFLIRLAMVAGAALAISLVTYFFVPGAFIFFGILHQIALASLIGLAFLRLPALVTLAVAAVVIAAPFHARSALFDHPAWWWLGLSPMDPRSNDYVPVFPWFGAVLAGIASARLASTTGLLERLVRLKAPRLWLLQFAGRHSLAFYLIHQPVLIGCIWVFAQVFPAATETPEVLFRQSCEAHCADFRDAEFCTRYCVCMLDELEASGMADAVLPDEQSAAQLQNLATLCTERTDKIMSEGGQP